MSAMPNSVAIRGVRGTLPRAFALSIARQTGAAGAPGRLTLTGRAYGGKDAAAAPERSPGGHTAAKMPLRRPSAHLASD
jgi:hypothetical protein